MVELQKKLCYCFKNLNLLRCALTHSSSGCENNQRMEFLGDAVLELVVSEQIYFKNPLLSEGKLTKLRAELVCEKSLVNIARALDIGRMLILGKGEELNGGREKPSILADAVEAVIGAVYIDGGFEAAANVIENLFDGGFAGGESEDYKSKLQEYCQKYKLGKIEYKLTRTEGPPHDSVIYVTVSVGGDMVKGEFKGKTKKLAEQNAAKAALDIFIGKNEE